MENKDGFLVINKDKGCTSHDCVKQIRKLLNCLLYTSDAADE